jgi:hypothetical protein
MMRGRTVLLWLVLITGAFISADWWREANAPMTSEKLAEMCGDRSECYPEIGYLLGALLMGVVAASAGVLLIDGGLRWIKATRQ